MRSIAPIPADMWPVAAQFGARIESEREMTKRIAYRSGRATGKTDVPAAARAAPGMRREIGESVTRSARFCASRDPFARSGTA